MDDLEPTDPTEGVELYIDHRRREGFEATLRSHRPQLGYFVR